MTPIGVKYREIRNLYVLVIFAPGSRRKILTRREARRPWLPLDAGEALRIGGRRVVVEEVVRRVERRGDEIEHLVEVFLRGHARKVKPMMPPNVVQMPAGKSTIVAQFMRLQVLVRVFDGDPEAWLEHLRTKGDGDGDLRFVRWIRSRLRHDPALLETIRRMVDTTPLRLSAGGGRL